MKRSLSRGEKRLGLICTIVILGLGGVGITRARLDAEPDWGIPAPQPTPNPNGYDLYLAAAAALVRARPSVDPVDDLNPPQDPRQRAARYSLARRTVWVGQNIRTWKLFERAEAADSLYPQDHSGNVTGLRAFGTLRNSARAKIAVANTAKLRGDWNEAAQSGLDIIEMGDDVVRGASIIGTLVGQSIDKMGVKTFSDVVPHLNGAEARAASRRLEKLLATRQPVVEAAREEKWEGLARLRQTFHTKQWRRPSSWGMKVSLSEKVKTQFLSKREVVESYRNALDENIAAMQRPYSPGRSVAPEPDNVVNANINFNCLCLSSTAYWRRRGFHCWSCNWPCRLIESTGELTPTI